MFQPALVGTALVASPLMALMVALLLPPPKPRPRKVGEAKRQTSS